MSTNLMLFFLLLYGFTRLADDKQQEMYGYLQTSGSRTGEMRYRADRVIREFGQADTSSAMNILAASMGDDAAIEEDAEQIRLTLNNPVLFPSGSSEIASRSDIDRLAYVLAQFPNNIIIEGHTDDVPVRTGPYRSNWELSAARSVSVIKEFVASHGLAPERFTAAGYGEFHPRFPNDTPANRAANRRIEIVVLK